MAHSFTTYQYKISNKLLNRPNSPLVKSDVKKKQQETHHSSGVIARDRVCVTSSYDSGKTPLDSHMLRQVSLVYPTPEFLILNRFIFSMISLIPWALLTLHDPASSLTLFHVSDNMHDK